MTDSLSPYIDWQARGPARTAEVADSPEYAGAGGSIHDELGGAVDALRPELEDLARALFEDPEIGFQEHRTIRRIADLVEAHGIAVELGAFGVETAFRASAGSAEGPHFAVIAEYDALPEVGQACGHNIIAGIGVGAFLALAPLAERLGGQVSLIGTPAEENGGGKEYLIQAGAFDDVDAAGMVHPSAGDAVSPITGLQNTGVRRVGVTYRGRAAHAADSPWLGRNALDAVVSAYQGVAQLRQHILPIDRVHGIITDGGTAPNIVPERASAMFYVRSAEIETLRALTDRVVAVLEAAALATGTVAEIDVDPVPPYVPLSPNIELNKRWARSVERRGRDVPPPPPVPVLSGGSTDMGNVTLFIPAIQPTIGLGAPDGVNPHNAAFAEATLQPSAFSAMADAAVAVASTAADYLADPALRTAVAAEFAANGGRYRWQA